MFSVSGIKLLDMEVYVLQIKENFHSTSLTLYLVLLSTVTNTVVPLGLPFVLSYFCLLVPCICQTSALLLS